MTSMLALIPRRPDPTGFFYSFRASQSGDWRIYEVVECGRTDFEALKF